MAVGGAIVVAGVGVVEVPAAATPAPVDRTAAPPGCVVPKDAALQPAATETPEGYLSHQAWIAAPPAQQVVAAVNRAIDHTFGHPDQVSARERLERGLIGSAADHYKQTLVVVVDPDRVAPAALSARLHDSIARQRAASRDRLPDLRVEVRVACFPAKDLLAAEAVLAERTWHPGAASASYLYYLDASDSTYHVSFDSKHQAVAQALRQRLGSRTTVTVEPTSADMAPLSGRLDDPEPHWGGSRITDGTFDCTSGFAVVEKAGSHRPGMVTAGHCWPAGSSVSSGTNPFGTTITSVENATQDMALMVSDPSQPTSYDHFIYTDPGPPDVRNVVGRADPPLNSSVCISGSVTLAKCSITVISVGGGTSCGTVCTNGLDVGQRSGVVISQPGDSGAPIYVRTGTDGAIIAGMHIGKPIGFPSVGVIAFHRVSQVEAGLGVTVSTG